MHLVGLYTYCETMHGAYSVKEQTASVLKPVFRHFITHALTTSHFTVNPCSLFNCCIKKHINQQSFNEQLRRTQFLFMKSAVHAMTEIVTAVSIPEALAFTQPLAAKENVDSTRPISLRFVAPSNIRLPFST